MKFERYLLLYSRRELKTLAFRKLHEAVNITEEEHKYFNKRVAEIENMTISEMFKEYPKSKMKIIIEKAIDGYYRYLETGEFNYE